jgi:uncharacterized membrane protein
VNGATPRIRWFRIREKLRMSLWVAPAAGVAAAIVAAAAFVTIDRRFPQGERWWFLFGGGADSARNLLSVIAASMVTSISLIFSVTMVVLQLASGQYSPRVLRTFIRDRLVEIVLASYIGTFVYCLLVLPSVRSGGGASTDSEYVPALAVSAALAFALVSLGLFVRYVHHIAHAIRGITIINAVAEETRSALERLYPDQLGDDAAPEQPLPAGEATTVVCWTQPPAVLVAVDEDTLMDTVEAARITTELLVRIGDFLPTGAPLFKVWGDLSDPEHLARCVTVGAERTMHQDAAYGFRQLVDIAERALSPGVNDPTTAVQCLDHLHDLLRRLVQRALPSIHRLGSDGTLRVVAPRLGWDDYVHLAFDEIRHYGADSIQVVRRLEAALGDLLSLAPPERRRVLEGQLDLIRSAARRELPEVVG